MGNTELDIKKITLYNGEHEYIGLPIRVFACNKSRNIHGGEDMGTWTGNSNLKSHGAPLRNISILSLADAFRMIAEWSSDEERNDVEYPYLYGYIADYDNKTLYYDDPKVISSMSRAIRGNRFIDDFIKVVLVPNWSADITGWTVNNRGEVEGIW